MPKHTEKHPNLGSSGCKKKKKVKRARKLAQKVTNLLGAWTLLQIKPDRRLKDTPAVAQLKQINKEKNVF